MKNVSFVAISQKDENRMVGIIELVPLYPQLKMCPLW